MIQTIKKIIVRVENPDLKTKDEFMAVFTDWPEQFGCDEKFMDLEVASRPPTKEHFQLTIYPQTRRHFAVLPAIIRKATKLGYNVICNDSNNYLHPVDMDEAPGEFWQLIALAQMWYEKPTA